MGELRSQWEMVVQPRDRRPKAAVATSWLDDGGKMTWHQDPQGRDAGRTMESHQTWFHTVGSGAMDPEETSPVLRDHRVTAFNQP